MRNERVACVFVLAATSACIAPSVVASTGRVVAVEERTLEWREATTADVVGFFESERITGEVAASLARVNYVFAADGYYTGAALVLGGERPEYQTLVGTWRLDGARLVLDDGEPVELAAADQRLRISTPEGELVLRRAALE